MAKLDVSKATESQMAEILRLAADVRKFEIDLFWRRSLFFWGFIGAALVAYGVMIRESDKSLPFAIACFGFVCSIAWTLANRGSKYWQEAWEQKVESVQCQVLNCNLFCFLDVPSGFGY